MDPSRADRIGAAEVAMYIPVTGHPAMEGIANGSAIVGRPAGRGDLRIYFQDDPHGAVNLATFAQRALVAYERLIDRAPTHMTRVVPRDALLVVGTYSGSRRQVTLVGPGSEANLLAWLEVDRLEPPELRA
jgi:hypothetical protein